MKKVLLAAAALASVIAAPAFAAPKGPVADGGDGRGTYEITGKASDFCELGQVTSAGSAGGTNVTVDVTTKNSGGYNGATSDAMININTFQNPTSDTPEAWRAVLNLRHSVCNEPYTVTAQSTSGGLAYQGTANGDGNFTKLTRYTVKADFGQNDGQAHEANTLTGAGQTILTGDVATAGDFRLTFNGPAENGKYLLSGTYTDTVLVVLSANTGTSPA